jgi:hypothetical protein
VQGEPVKLPTAVPVNVNATVPAGVEIVPALASTTVAVHTEPWATITVEGLHETVVVVERRVGGTTLIVNPALVLPA